MEYWKARHIAGFASKEFRWTPASNKKESAFKRRRPMPSVGYNKIPDTGYRISTAACQMKLAGSKP